MATPRFSTLGARCPPGYLLVLQMIWQRSQLAGPVLHQMCQLSALNCQSWTSLPSALVILAASVPWTVVVLRAKIIMGSHLLTASQMMTCWQVLLGTCKAEGASCTVSDRRWCGTFLRACLGAGSKRCPADWINGAICNGSSQQPSSGYHAITRTSHFLLQMLAGLASRQYIGIQNNASLPAPFRVLNWILAAKACYLDS